MNIDRAWIQRHIPHQGTMCLLDAVSHWDETQIECSAHSHIALTNPLRNVRGLPISAGIEYAAQAMAVHGALLASSHQLSQVGYLTHVRNVQWWVSQLDAAGAELTVQATRISGNEVSLLYDFRVLGRDRLLLCGRAGVLTQPTPPPEKNFVAP